MRCGNCEQEPCTCQRQLKVGQPQPDVPQKYLFRKCVNPACTVMIGWMVGSLQGETTCKWCQANLAHWQQEVG